MESEPGGAPVDALTDIRVGFNIIDLRRARHAVTLPVRERIDLMLDTLAVTYRARVERNQPPDERLLGCIDQAMEAVCKAGTEAGRADALLGPVGIRRGLFPHAPRKERYA